MPRRNEEFSVRPAGNLEEAGKTESAVHRSTDERLLGTEG